MAVSLKKTSNEKVDLTKSPMSGKLPECNPVHLIDEEETIKSRVSQPKISDVQIRLCHSEEEEREIWDLWEKANRRESLKRVLKYVIAAVSVIVLVVLVVVCVSNLPDFESEAISELYSSVFGLFYSLFCNPFFILLLVFSFFIIGLHFLRRLLK